MSFERSVAEWLGVKVRHVVFSSDLLDVDHSQVHLFAYVVDDHKKMLAFLKVRLVVRCDSYDGRVVLHNDGW